MAVKVALERLQGDKRARPKLENRPILAARPLPPRSR
jgi:hypothetical protein